MHSIYDDDDLRSSISFDETRDSLVTWIYKLVNRARHGHQESILLLRRYEADYAADIQRLMAGLDALARLKRRSPK